MKTTLKWAGGKSWFVPTLKELLALNYIDSSHTFVDPFCGSCAVPIALGLTNVVVADMNEALINYWQMVKAGTHLHAFADWDYDKSTYTRNRKNFNTLVDLCASIGIDKVYHSFKSEMASLFYYLNRTCFNGLWRVNSDGYFNVPMGSYKTVSFNTSVRPFGDLLDTWDIRYGDFGQTFYRSDIVRPFFYIDPPYFIEGHVDYTAGGFGWEHQVELANELALADAPTVAHNSDHHMVVDLYKSLGFEAHPVHERRRISSKSSTRSGTGCMVFTKNLEVGNVFSN